MELAIKQHIFSGLLKFCIDKNVERVCGRSLNLVYCTIATYGRLGGVIISVLTIVLKVSRV
jgi:hypothetical protein